MITKVLSVGGSIVAPERPDEAFLHHFIGLCKAYARMTSGYRLVLVIGGGAPARVWQGVYRDICQDQAKKDEADWIGIMATRLNAQLVKACLGEFCTDPVVTDPTGEVHFTGKVLVAGGWKPGFSTDNDAVLLAEKFGAKTVVNLSNIEKVYTDDPRKNSAARPIDAMSWDEFIALVGSEWEPGKNAPFDPVASRKAKELGISVICASGRDLDNIRSILEEREFVGTMIGGSRSVGETERTAGEAILRD